MEWSFGDFISKEQVLLPVEYWSGVKFWSGKSVCALLIKLCILWSGDLEQSIGVESDFGAAKVEWSAVVMCVCGQVLCYLVTVMDQ